MKLLRDNASALVPVAAAWYSVLATAAANLRTAGGLQNLWPGLGIATLTGALAWLLSAWLTPEPSRRTLIAVALVAWFAGYGLFGAPLLEAGVPDVVTLAATATMLVIVVILILRLRGSTHTAAKLVRTTVLIVLLFPLYSFASTYTAGARRVSGSEDGAVRSVPVTSNDRSPSVFLIVLDKYTGSSSLLRNYGYDNRPFEDRLRERGFFVPRESRSNYPHTSLSLASMLNWTLLDDLPDGTTEPVRELLRRVHDNRTWRFFKGRGYEYVFLPTTFSSTRFSRFADRMIPPPRITGVNVRAAWFSSTAAGSMIRVLSGGRLRPIVERFFALYPYPIESAAEIERKFEILATLAEEEGQRFVFAHLLVPHEPYIFNSDCSHRKPLWPQTDYIADQGAIRQAYVAQIQCVNRMLESLIDHALSQPGPEPIILIQADHGHGMMAVNPFLGHQLPHDQLDPDQVFERTDVFAAYYLPDGGASVMYDSITPVNLLPAVLNYYFDADIQPSEDAVYLSRFHPPFDMLRLR